MIIIGHLERISYDKEFSPLKCGVTFNINERKLPRYIFFTAQALYILQCIRNSQGFRFSQQKVSLCAESQQALSA